MCSMLEEYGDSEHVAVCACRHGVLVVCRPIVEECCLSVGDVVEQENTVFAYYMNIYCFPE